MKNKILAWCALSAALLLTATACDVGSEPDSTVAESPTDAVESVYSQGLTYAKLSDDACSVTGIGACTDTEIVIPSRYEGMAVVAIGERAFYGCEGVTSVTIPAGVTSVGEYAFALCSDLTSVTLPEGVTKLGEWAFYNCRNLVSVTLPNSLLQIGLEAFTACPALTSFSVKPNHPTLSADGGILYNRDRTVLLSYPSASGNVTVRAGVTAIGSAAFSQCRALSSVVLPDGVTFVGDSAFSACYSLTSVEIPETMTYLGGGAFSNCYCLTAVRIPRGVTEVGQWTFSQCRMLSTVELSDTVTVIGDQAFLGCVGLMSITLPAGVSELHTRAFNGCENLLTVTVDEGNLNLCSKDGIVYTKDMTTLLFCPDRKVEVTIPDSVTAIGEEAFAENGSLRAVRFGSGVRKIGYQAFFNCRKLDTVTLSDGLAEIGLGAFRGTALTSVRIPASVTFMDAMAFAECSRLTDVYYGGSEDEWNALAKEDGWAYGSEGYTLRFNPDPEA